MPSINLRLTDEELAELRAWAFDSRRSLQKEIVWRLFSADGTPKDRLQSAAGFITPQGREEAKRVMPGNTDLIEHFPQSAPRGVDDHFKPDPK